MLGSLPDAEDVVQETFTRAWRRHADFEPLRGSARTWLFAIATNLSRDVLRRRGRRARPVDLGGPVALDAPLGAPAPPERWITPVPDSAVLPEYRDPADAVAARESITLAFVAALQRLPARQRAVVILADVLAWRTDEIAGLLATTSTAVAGVLRRARQTLARYRDLPVEPAMPLDPAQRRLLDDYVAAFTAHDVESLVGLLRDDAVMSMPPFAAWWRGGRLIAEAVAGTEFCRNARLVPAAVNGAPGFGQYRPDPVEGGHVPWALVVLGIRDGRIAEVVTFLDMTDRFGDFGLPNRLPAVT